MNHKTPDPKTAEKMKTVKEARKAQTEHETADCHRAIDAARPAHV